MRYLYECPQCGKTSSATAPTYKTERIMRMIGAECPHCGKKNEKWLFVGISKTVFPSDPQQNAKFLKKDNG